MAKVNVFELLIRVETDSESENGEDEQLSLSDVIAQLSGETGDESSEKPTNETGESGEDNGKAVNDTSESRNKNTEAGDDSAEGGDISVVAKNENNEQIQEAIVNGPSGKSFLDLYFELFLCIRCINKVLLSRTHFLHQNYREYGSSNDKHHE